MKRPEIETLLFEDGVYRSRLAGTSVLGKMIPSVLGHYRILERVFWSAGKAKRGEYDNKKWTTGCVGVIRALESVGVRFEITGVENLKSFEGPCVFVSNHMSTLETFCLPGIILPFKPVTFVVKESLVRYPVFGHIMRATGAIPVSRRNPREDLRAVLEGGGQKLDMGISVVIFPQTTRTTEFDAAEFNTLGVKLARRSGVPVIPIALKTDAWGVGPFFLKDFGRIDPSRTVYMCFGEPFEVVGRGHEEHERVVEFITSKLREWRE